MEKVALWFLIFMTYSFGGWLVEVIISIFSHRKFINRGFLVGPFCPIYGTGAILLALILNTHDNIIAIFCVSVIGAGTLEYTTSFLMEKLFRVRWWDYSDQPMNLNGRVCLGALLSFGVIGVFAIKFLNPILIALYGAMPTIILYIVAGLLFVAMLADLALSFWLIFGVRVTVGTVKKDATDEISERVHDILVNKSRLNRRLIKAFPNQAPSTKSPKSKK